MSDADHLDRVIAESWPPAVVEERDGWLFRHTAGVTRRANSVLVDGRPADVEAAITAAERFYASVEQPPIFLCTDAITPVSVTDALRGRGFRPTAPTWVLVADNDVAPRVPSPWVIATTAAPTDDWFAVYWAGSHGDRSAGDRDVVRDVLLAPAHPAAFATVRSDADAVAAVGQVVVVEGTGSVQCLVTQAESRRRGAGRAVVQALMAEAGRWGAERFVAAVVADNEPSLRLFDQLGFRRSHRYAYFA